VCEPDWRRIERRLRKELMVGYTIAACPIAWYFALFDPMSEMPASGVAVIVAVMGFGAVIGCVAWPAPDRKLLPLPPHDQGGDHTEVWTNRSAGKAVRIEWLEINATEPPAGRLD